jgi:hypothetical protein
MEFRKTIISVQTDISTSLTYVFADHKILVFTYKKSVRDSLSMCDSRKGKDSFVFSIA